MAQANKAKCEFEDESFPLWYDRGNLRVYTNPSGELFVKDTRTGTTMRINPGRPGGLEFTTDARVEPVNINNMIGWRVTPR